MVEKEVWFIDNNKKRLSGILHIPDGDEYRQIDGLAKAVQEASACFY